MTKKVSLHVTYSYKPEKNDTTPKPGAKAVHQSCLTQKKEILAVPRTSSLHAAGAELAKDQVRADYDESKLIKCFSNSVRSRGAHVDNVR